jgi:hypothetical protein
MKINMGQKWYQSIAYDLPLGHLWFILNFKGPRPLKFEEKNFNVLMTFDMA